MRAAEGLIGALRAARDFRPQNFVPLRLGTSRIGWVRRNSADRLRAWPGVFDVSLERISVAQIPQEDLSAAFAGITLALEREGAITGWRDETYAVRAESSGEPLFHIERAATHFFGLTSAAAHLNGFVSKNGELTIWIARRSATKATDPGMLDTLVGGGVPSGEDPWQTLLRECGEEAGLPLALAKKAQPAGLLRVCREVPDGLHSEILHVHDLVLPAEFSPRNTDGEVSEFLTLDPAALLEHIERGELTVEAGLVAADFVRRLGLMAP